MDVREKLVELMSYFADGYSIENRHIVDGTKVCDIADHLIANGVTVQEWISVKDRLPEVGTRSNGWGDVTVIATNGKFVQREKERRMNNGRFRIFKSTQQNVQLLYGLQRRHE